MRLHFSSVQSLSRVQLFATPWIAAHQASLSITNSWSSPRLMSIESVMPSNHLILCHPLLLLPPIPASIRVFSSESTLRMRWPKYWSFSFSISPSNKHPGLIWSPLGWTGWISLQSKGLKSLLQHHSSKGSILWRSAFFTVQLSHPYMTTGKTIALTRQTFVGKVMSLLFNKLSRLIITFLPRSERLNFMAAITICSDFGAQKNKVWYCFHCFPIQMRLSLTKVIIPWCKAYESAFMVCQGGSCTFKSQKILLRGMYIVVPFIKLPGRSDGEEFTCNAGDPVSIPWVGICWRKGWLSTPLFLPGEFHRQRSLSMGLWRVEYNWVTNTFTFFTFTELS